MIAPDQRIEIAGVYDFGPGEGDARDITLDEARRRKLALRDKLSSFDELDYGRIWFLRNHEFIEGFMPLSFSGFVRWAMVNAAEFAASGVTYLTLCEEYSLWHCSPSEVVVQVWPCRPTTEWKPHLGRGLLHATSFRVQSNSKELPLDRSEMRFELSIGLRDWLTGIRDLGRSHRELLLDVKEWIYANPNNFLATQDRQQVEEAFSFCQAFPSLEVKINAILEEVAERHPQVGSDSTAENPSG